MNDAQNTEGEFKKVHKLSLIDIFQCGKEKLIADKVTELRFNKKLRLERTDQFYDKLNTSISKNNLNLKKECDSIIQM